MSVSFIQSSPSWGLFGVQVLQDVFNMNIHLSLALVIAKSQGEILLMMTGLGFQMSAVHHRNVSDCSQGDQNKTFHVPDR